MVNVEFICKGLFVYFYKKLYRKPCSTYVSESDKAMSSYNGFRVLLKDKYSTSVGVEYIWNYGLFQFGRYLSKIEGGTVGFNGEITPAMIFGKKAFEVFEKRRTDMDFITKGNPLIVKYKVSIDEFIKTAGISVNKPKLSTKSVVNNIKQIVIRYPDPLITCIDMTDLYNPLDKSCKKCVDKEKCIKMLAELYPKVFKERSPL